MTKAMCPHEDATTGAARSGQWDSLLEKHAHECAVCREVVEISRWMRAMAQDAAQDHATNNDSSDASLLWWRAQLNEKQAKAARAQSVLEWTEMTLACMVAAALAGWAVWNWPLLQTAAGWLAASLSPQTWIAAYSAGASFWLILGVLSVAAVLLVYPIFAQE